MSKKLGLKIKYLVNQFLDNVDRSELLKGSFITLTFRVVGMLCSYLFYFILARIYGAITTGIFSLSMTVCSIFSMFGLGGTQIAIVRFVAKDAACTKFDKALNTYKKILSLILPFSIFAALTLFILSPLLARYLFHNPSLILPFKIISLAIPFVAFGDINIASLRGLKKIYESSFLQAIFPPLVNTIGLILLTYLVTRSYLTPIYSYLITGILGGFLSLFIWFNRVKPSVGTSITGDNLMNMREILRVSLPMLISSTMLLIMGWTDIITLGIFRTTKDIGIYKIALKVAMFITVTLAAVNSIAAPKFAELYSKKEFKRLQDTARFASLLVFWSSLPLVILFIALAREIMGLFGEEFLSGAAVLVILSIGQFVNVSCGPVGIFLNMTRYQNILKNIMVVSAILNLILNLILIPHYGIIGASVATAVSMTLWNIIASIYIYKKFKYWIGYIPKFLI